MLFLKTLPLDIFPVVLGYMPEARLRQAGGKVWKDETLSEWPDNDFRMFVGNLGTEVSDEIISSAFRKYKSFQKGKVVRDKRTLKSKGFGFVSFIEGADLLAALKEMNGKYIGNRPCQLKRAKWDDRNADSDKSKAAAPLENFRTHA